MWSGNREAQRQADNAYAKLRPKKRRKLNKRQRRQLEPPPATSFVAYAEYIFSDAWAKKRRAFFENAGFRCQLCGARSNLNVHHKHYRTLGREEREDVEVLCLHCHECHHEPDGVSMTDPLSKEFRSIVG